MSVCMSMSNTLKRLFWTFKSYCMLHFFFMQIGICFLRPTSFLMHKGRPCTWALRTIQLYAPLFDDIPEIHYLPTPLSTGSLYPKFQVQTSGIIQKLYETKTNTNTGWFKSVYWLFSEIKPKMCDFACFRCFSSKNGLNCNMTFR